MRTVHMHFISTDAVACRAWCYYSNSACLSSSSWLYRSSNFFLQLVVPSLVFTHYNWRALWKNRTSRYIYFFCPSLNGDLLPVFCLLMAGECQILVFLNSCF